MNGYASEEFEEIFSLEELVEISQLIVVAEKDTPHIRNHIVPVHAENVKPFLGWFALGQDEIEETDYHSYNRSIYVFKVIEILKMESIINDEPLNIGNIIYVAGADDDINFSGHIQEEIFRVHGLELYESPIISRYITHLFDYDDSNRMILFLNKGISILSEEEDLTDIPERNSLFTFAAENSYEAMTESGKIQQIIDR